MPNCSVGVCLLLLVPFAASHTSRSFCCRVSIRTEEEIASQLIAIEEDDDEDDDENDEEEEEGVESIEEESAPQG